MVSHSFQCPHYSAINMPRYLTINKYMSPLCPFIIYTKPLNKKNRQMYISISQAIIAFIALFIHAIWTNNGVHNMRFSQVIEILAVALFVSGFWTIWSTCFRNEQSSQECVIAIVQMVVGFASWGASLYREYNH